MDVNVRPIKLRVFTDNEKATNLYKSFEFKIKEARKYDVTINGQYTDEYIMTRYKNI